MKSDCLRGGPLVGLLLLLSVDWPKVAQSQNIELENLRTPTAPAFTLLDITPTAIERPHTPKELGLSLLSASNQDNLLPQNYALEVAPYWLFPHPTLTHQEYVFPSSLQSLKQNTSVSFATVPITGTGTEDTLGTTVGFGLRTLFLQGSLPASYKKLVDSLKVIQRQILLADDASSEQSLAEQAKQVALNIQQAAKNRYGLSLEFATAFAVAFPDDDFEDARLSRFGFWMTPSYRTLPTSNKKTSVNLLGVARYIYEDSGLLTSGDGAGSEKSSLVDVGMRLLLDVDEFSISGEGIFRKVLDSPKSPSGVDLNEDTYRLSLLAEYEINNNVKVFASFGRNYDAANVGNNTLIALVGLNYGLGKTELPLSRNAP